MSDTGIAISGLIVFGISFAIWRYAVGMENSHALIMAQVSSCCAAVVWKLEKK